MTTRILKRFDFTSMDYLEALLEVGFKTVGQVVELEKATQRIKNIEISKIINILGREARN